MDIEKEIESRINFKLNELLTGLKNTASANWNISMHHGSQKHEHYWEAFKQMEAMLNKEMRMLTPRNDMAEANRRDKNDIAVEKIMGMFCPRGSRDYHPNQKRISEIVKDAQNW